MTKRTCRLSQGKKTLTITQGKKVTQYQIENLFPDADLADPAFRLVKNDGKEYTVHVDKWGCHCDCPDAHWRKDKRGEFCKHLSAMAAVGLIPEEERDVTVPNEAQEEF